MNRGGPAQVFAGLHEVFTRPSRGLHEVKMVRTVSKSFIYACVPVGHLQRPTTAGSGPAFISEMLLQRSPKSQNEFTAGLPRVYRGFTSAGGWLGVGWGLAGGCHNTDMFIIVIIIIPPQNSRRTPAELPQDSRRKRKIANHKGYP